jgi:DnaK suppressor protein
MDAETLQRFRDMLLRAVAVFEAQAESAREVSKPVALDQAAVGRLSRVDAMQAQQMHLAMKRRRAEQLRRIEGALRRIDAGTYGACFVCGADIGAARLEVEPTLTRCIDCVRDAEQNR